MSKFFALTVISSTVAFESVINPNNVTFDDEIIQSYGELTWNGFRRKYKDIDESFRSKMEEHYRVLKRDCFNSGKCKRGTQKKLRNVEKEAVRKKNAFDESQICPDSVNGEAWHFGSAEELDVTIDGETIILDQSVDAGMIVIKNGGKLIFRDNGEGTNTIVLRAKSIKVTK